MGGVFEVGCSLADLIFVDLMSLFFTFASMLTILMLIAVRITLLFEEVVFVFV